MTYSFITTNSAEYIAERELRAKVLREPLGLPRGAEVFPFENDALHLVAIDSNEVVGCVMFKPEGMSGRMLQMAVRSDRQHGGIGSHLVQTLEERLMRDGYREIYLHARDTAVRFYERLGYRAEGEPFVEVGISHVRMKKCLDTSR